MTAKLENVNISLPLFSILKKLLEAARRDVHFNLYRVKCEDCFKVLLYKRLAVILRVTTSIRFENDLFSVVDITGEI